ncbi:sensor histidine kinase [Paenibacillus sp. J5C_2022]|uniref:cache domain-containing sensor histidine kinase n=1 Tax=Paenibacillus sp. J5C2022 TaxID=2977129 RepID=UPI0021D11931|nr:sensor histidine kinase [Paenibacillus sp. J5C2022]MCU6711361.1 sensor histidine kinase [Paenibacillus sp. J5C2022]
MKNKRRLSFRFGRNLRVQLRMSFMLITLIVLAMSAALTYNGVMGILEKNTNDSSLQYMTQAGNAINAFREEIDKISRQLLIDSQIQEFLDNHPLEIADRIILHRDIMALMNEFIESHDYIHSIFLYAEDGRVVGVMENKTALLEDPLKQGAYYSSYLHTQVMNHDIQNSFPKIIWVGAKRSEEFGEMPNASKGGSQNIVTAARAIKSLYQSLPSATLMINIKEEKLFSLYNNNNSPGRAKLYMCDISGQIISHSDKSLLGTKNGVCGLTSVAMESGSFKHNEEQIVHYPLADTDWTMIQAVPVREYIVDLFKLRYQLIWILVVSLIAALVISSIWIKKITKPMQRLMEAMGEMEKGNLDFTIAESDRNEFGRLSIGFNRMSVGIKELIEQNRVVEDKKRKIEIQMLQSQINPHFLFNTLNTIKWMAAMHKADNIMKSIAALGSLLQPIFKKPGLLCPLREEIDYAGHYIQIMNYRYGEGIRVEFVVEPLAESCVVPRFILQPLIENAVLHGFERSGYAGQIRIEAESNPSFLFIRVIDDGQGMSEETLLRVREWISAEIAEEEETAAPSSFGIGLRNVHRRMRLMFPSSPGLSMAPVKTGGIQVELVIPTN